MDDVVTFQPAGLLRRIIASLVDGILLSFVLFGLFMILPNGTAPSSFEIYNGTVLMPMGAREISWMYYFSVLIAVSWVYFSLFEALPMSTIGKHLVGLRVTDMTNSRISIGRSLLRFPAKLISVLPLGIGLLAAGFGSKRTFHDMLTSTQVIRV